MRRIIPMLLLASTAYGDDRAAYQKTADSVALVISVGNDWERSYGTGVLIRPGFVLTNYHLVAEKLAAVAFPIAYDGSYMVGLASYNIMRQECRLVAHDLSRDLALLRIIDVKENRKPLTLAKRSGKPGQAVFTVDGEWRYRGGSVHRISPALDQFVSGPKVVEVDGGSDGSPVFNKAGRILGIIYKEGNGVDVSEIRAFLDNAAKDNPELQPKGD